MHDEAPHIVSDVAEADFDVRPVETDGPDFHAHAVFLIGEDVFDEGADFRSCGVAAPYVIRHRLPRRLLSVDVGDQAVL